MPLLKTLSRSLRARDDDSASDPYSDELEASSPSVLDTGDNGGGDVETSEDEPGSKQDDDEDEEDVSDAGDDIKQQLSRISFGALAKAQDALSARTENGTRKRKRGAAASAEQEAKLQALRERLREIKAGKTTTGRGQSKGGGGGGEAVTPTAGAKRAKTSEPVTRRQSLHERDSSSSDEESSSSAESGDDDGDDDDGDAPPREETTRAPHHHRRPSKHAPTTQSSKRAVPRARQVVAPAATGPKPRDPRFDPLAGPPNAAALRANYAFLDGYRAAEMGELRAAIEAAAKTKKKAGKGGKGLAEEGEELLKRKLASMESQERARREREREERVVREHRRAEKEKVGVGKKPFYLKKSELKRRALIDRFENMKGKERDRAIERRRKKVAAKEKRNMPAARRGVGEA